MMYSVVSSIKEVKYQALRQRSFPDGIGILRFLIKTGTQGSNEINEYDFLK